MSSTAWAVLVVAGLFEAAWAVGLEYSDGFTKPVPSAATVVALVISMGLLAWAIRELPVGTAYAVWTGIGAVLVTLLGIVLFDEPASAIRMVFIGLIVTGIVGLHQVS